MLSCIDNSPSPNQCVRSLSYETAILHPDNYRHQQSHKYPDSQHQQECLLVSCHSSSCEYLRISAETTKLKPYQEFPSNLHLLSILRTQISRLLPVSPSPLNNKQSSARSSTSSLVVPRYRNSPFGATTRPSRIPLPSPKAARSTRRNGMVCRARLVRSRDSTTVSKTRGTQSLWI